MRYYTKERAEHNARVAERRHTMTLYLGKVSCDLHNLASRVRVSVIGTDGIPLSVKATRNGFSRNYFTKGRTVEVERCKSDGRKFRVTKVFEVLNPQKEIEVTVNFHQTVPTPAEFYGRQKYGNRNWKGKTMENVKFYLNSNYFDHPELARVLNRVFRFSPGEFSGAKCRGAGVTFICTTDQFARFLIERNLNGINNGFMDLGAKLICPTPQPNAYDLLAKAAGITHDQAKRVSLALCYSGPQDILERIKTDPHPPRDHARQIDVSDR